eukprot:6013289-Prymnesium_polylepis.1
MQGATWPLRTLSEIQTSAQVLEKKIPAWRFSWDRERWACSFFRELAGRRCWIQELRLAVALARKEHAHRLSAIDLLGTPLIPRPQLAYPCRIAHAP